MDTNQRLLPPPEHPDSDPPSSRPVTSGFTGRNTKGQFIRGSHGNPKGRPLGSRNRACLEARAVLEEKAAELAKKVMDDALLNGNPIAYKLCLERLVPIPQDSPVALHLSEPGSKASETAPERMFEAHNALIRRVANGDVSPNEAESISRLFDSRRRAWETLEFHRRLEDVETRLRRNEKVMIPSTGESVVRDRGRFTGKSVMRDHGREGGRSARSPN